jgi:hypothetical protein
MPRDETPEEHQARIKDAERTADAVNEAANEYLRRERQNITGGVHNGNVTFRFDRPK